MKRFFLFCSGANLRILAQCRTDETKYAGIGATIVLTAMMATFSGGYALFTVFRSVPAAIAFGLFWGVVIFNLDRVIVSGMRKQKHLYQDVAFALPRLALAVLLAAVISRPLELKMYAREIRAETVRMADEEHNAALNRISEGSGRLKELRTERDSLNRVLADRENEVDRLWAELNAEMDGSGGTQLRGDGPQAAEKRRRLQNEQAKQDTAKRAIEPRVRAIDGEIHAIEDQQKHRLAVNDQVEGDADGLLKRMQAFARLKSRNHEILLASWFITLVFVALEVAPMMVKLLSTLHPYRPYEELLEEHEAALVEESRQRRKVRKHELEGKARQEMSDVEASIDTEIRLNGEKQRLRLDAELEANRALMEQIAAAQSELAQRIVEEWKLQELDKIDRGQTTFVP